MDSRYDGVESEDIDGLTLEEMNEDILVDIAPKFIKKDSEKKSKRIYVDPLELHTELEKHIISRSMNGDHVMHRKLANMLIKIVDELFEKGNFRNYHNGWKYEMKSKAYENLVKYSHMYKLNFVEQFAFFLNWIYRVHPYKLQKFFEDHSLDYVKFIDNLEDVKRKIFKKSKDPNFVPSDTYKKLTPNDLIPYLISISYDFEMFTNELFEQYGDLAKQFDDHKKRNSFNYITQIIYRSAQYVIKNEKKISNDNKRLDEAILYRTDDFDEEAVEQDNRFITFDENKLDYGGFID